MQSTPSTTRAIPIWVADYVLISYGTGAIMAVPAHDTRDFEFAVEFELPIVTVVDPGPGAGEARDKLLANEIAFIEDGTAINSGPYTGLATGRVQTENRRGPLDQGAGPKRGQLQAPRLAVQPAALLGRAVPDPPRVGRRWPPDRSRACAGTEGPAGRPARTEMKFDAAHASPEPPLDAAPDEWLYVTVDGKRYKRETK